MPTRKAAHQPNLNNKKPKPGRQPKKSLKSPEVLLQCVSFVLTVTSQTCHFFNAAMAELHEGLHR